MTHNKQLLLNFSILEGHYEVLGIFRPPFRHYKPGPEFHRLAGKLVLNIFVLM